MQRANRQIEMLDLKTLNVLIGGVAGNPENMGMVAPKDDFAPRVGAVYRLGEKTVVRAGYGLTYDGRSWGAIETLRGQASYPLALNGTFQTPAAQANFGWYGTLNDGIPLLNGPDLSKGSIPLPNTVGMTTAVPASTQRGKTHSWNVALERRLPFVSVDVAYVGNRQSDGLTNTVNVNPVLHLGGGATDRPYFASNGRQLAINIFTPYIKDGVQRAAGRHHKASYARSSPQRPLHLRQRLVAWDQLPASRSGSAGSELGRAGHQPAAYLHDGFRLPGAVEHGDRFQPAAVAHEQLAGERSLPGVQRHAIHGDRRCHDPQHAEQHTDG